MTKLVKVTVSGMPIVSTPVPFTMGTHGPVELPIEAIFKCLVGGAQVFEVFPNGKQLRLDLNNYSTENTPEEVKVPVETFTPAPPVLNDIPPVVDNTDSEADTLDPVDEKEESEDATEETSEEEGSRSPEHWQPPKQAPQQNSQQGKYNGNNKRR